MTTFIMIIRKRPDLTRAEFVVYYETKHLQLIGRLVGGKPTAYRRHYAVTGDELVQRLAAGRGDAVAEDVSAVTEVTFADRRDAEAMVDRMLAQDVLPQVLADEQNFIAENGIQWFLAERR